jgi:hypothetical protein
MRPCLEKNPSKKRAVVVAQCVGPAFKPRHQKKKKESGRIGRIGSEDRTVEVPESEEQTKD